MSIDYNANYGVGYEVDANDELTEEYDGSVEEYLECNLSPGFICFAVGNYMIGEIDGVYVAIENCLSDGLDLSRKKLLLNEEMKRLKLDVISEFGLHGGVLVW